MRKYLCGIFLMLTALTGWAQKPLNRGFYICNGERVFLR